MPELPEVETTVRQLRQAVLQTRIMDVWSDCPGLIKKPKRLEVFKNQIKGRVIKGIERYGKNIIFALSDGLSLLIHQKLTGHLLYGKWQKRGNTWQAMTKGPLESDSQNRFLHLILFLNNGKQLALSDLRKFARVELWKTKELWDSEEIKKIGPDALSPSLTFSEFQQRLSNKRAAIKRVLMDQEVIAGIGNIYSDEILFQAGVRPTRPVSDLDEKELKAIYQSMGSVLEKAIELKGTSIADYRTIEGKRGGFDSFLQVYGREGEKCFRCGAKIKRIKIGNRSAHFCPKCQR